MVDLLYLAFRGASGFALIVVGLGQFFSPARSTATRAMGALFSSVGALFCLSALDPVLPLPDEVGNFVVIGLVYAVSQALFELTLYLFGDAQVERQKLRVTQFGVVLSLAVWALPLFDYLLGAPVQGTSVEDGHALGPLHAFLGPVIYAWPLVVTVLSIQMGRWRLSDLSLRSRALRGLVFGLGSLVVVFLVLVISLSLGWGTAYRIAQTALQVLMLAWFFVLNRFPNHFEWFRQDIAQRHEKNRRFEASEHEVLAARLKKIVEEGTLLWDPELNLVLLAARVGVPAYLLSAYFNSRLGTTFSAWLNVLRIARVCQKMAEDPDSKILDLAFEAGYNSKSTFNLQFSKIVGMRPTAYRASHNPQLGK